MRVTIRAARVNAGMSQQQAAKAVGVTFYKLQAWESGKVEPKVSDLYKMAKAYGCTISDFLLPLNIT